jgi:shikimate kinase
MNIVIIGFKSCGKSVVGPALAKKLGKKFLDSDEVLEKIYEKEKGKKLAFREIYLTHGKNFFRKLEDRAVKKISKQKGAVISLGGGTLMHKGNIAALKKKSRFVYLKASPEKLLGWILKSGIPAFLEPNDLEGSMRKELEKREPVYLSAADYVFDYDSKKNLPKQEFSDDWPNSVADEIIKLLKMDNLV